MKIFAVLKKGEIEISKNFSPKYFGTFTIEGLPNSINDKQEKFMIGELQRWSNLYLRGENIDPQRYKKEREGVDLPQELKIMPHIEALAKKIARKSKKEY